MSMKSPFTLHLALCLVVGACGKPPVPSSTESAKTQHAVPPAPSPVPPAESSPSIPHATDQVSAQPADDGLAAEPLPTGSPLEVIQKLADRLLAKGTPGALRAKFGQQSMTVALGRARTNSDKSGREALVAAEAQVARAVYRDTIGGGKLPSAGSAPVQAASVLRMVRDTMKSETVVVVMAWDGGLSGQAEAGAIPELSDLRSDMIKLVESGQQPPLGALAVRLRDGSIHLVGFLGAGDAGSGATPRPSMPARDMTERVRMDALGLFVGLCGRNEVSWSDGDGICSGSNSSGTATVRLMQYDLVIDRCRTPEGLQDERREVTFVTMPWDPASWSSDVPVPLQPQDKSRGR